MRLFFYFPSAIKVLYVLLCIRYFYISLLKIEVFSWIRTSTLIILLESMGIRLELTGMKAYFD